MANENWDWRHRWEEDDEDAAGDFDRSWNQSMRGGEERRGGRMGDWGEGDRQYRYREAGQSQGQAGNRGQQYRMGEDRQRDTHQRGWGGGQDWRSGGQQRGQGWRNQDADRNREQMDWYGPRGENSPQRGWERFRGERGDEGQDYDVNRSSYWSREESRGGEPFGQEWQRGYGQQRYSTQRGGRQEGRMEELRNYYEGDYGHQAEGESTWQGWDESRYLGGQPRGRGTDRDVQGRQQSEGSRINQTINTSDWRTRGPYTGMGPKGYQRNDERIHEDVCEMLSEHPQIDARNVNIEVQNGTVNLTGTVASKREKWLAEDLVEASGGVREVNNQLRIKQDEERSLGETIRSAFQDLFD